MNLTHKIILITGGGTGLGLAYAKALNTSGNTVIICGRRKDKLDAAVVANPGLIAIPCDVADDAQVETMLKTIHDEHGGLDVLFNNAGVYHEYDIPSTDDAIARVEREIAINLTSPIKMIIRALPMLTERSGAIVNISSGLAYVPFARAAVYSATRAGLHFFTRNLRRQLENSAVTVFEVLPPMMDTAMVAHVPDDRLPKMPPTEVAQKSLAAIRKGQEEIPLGMAKQLRLMSRLAPGFIEGQISKD